MRNEPKYKKPESSSEKINYLVRPAKQVERKLIIEALICLRKIYPIETYQYVGMGSLFYVDYQMFHKYLGIKNMISMEMEEDKIDRFTFNKPYDFITLISGISTDILPTLQWQTSMLIWLDYDSNICQGVINDIQIICNYIRPGGILIITLDAEPKRFESLQRDLHLSVNKERFENFKKALYPYYPSNITEKDLSVKKYPLLLRQIIVSVIEDKLRKRHLKFFQMFNFKYADTSKMYTFGCVFEEMSNKIESTDLFDLDFVSRDTRIVEINVPIITPLEKIHFDKLIPEIAEKLSDFEMDKKQLNDYEKYYKYYPQYFEALL